MLNKIIPIANKLSFNKFFFVIPTLLVVAGFYAGRIIDDRAKSLLQTIKLSEDNAKNTNSGTGRSAGNA
jgi:hypothetical protein